MAIRHSSCEPTRREFLAALPLAAAAAACRRTPYAPASFALPGLSEVALLPAADYGASAVDAVSRGISLLRPAVRDRRVFLKPNLVEYESGTMINTHPVIIAAAIEAFRRAGAREVVVGEGPGHRRDTEYLLDASGLSNYLRELRTPFIDLNLDDVRPVALKSRFMGRDALLLPVEVLKSDVVVSMAKLKTHHWAGMTAAMKNLFGLVPGAVYGWPKNLLHHCGIDSSILDLNATVCPGFAIVDAIVAMEGDGPIMGTARKCGFLAMGADSGRCRCDMRPNYGARTDEDRLPQRGLSLPWQRSARPDSPTRRGPCPLRKPLRDPRTPESAPPPSLTRLR